LDELRVPLDLLNELGRPADAELYQGSMGIYVFNRQILIDALDNREDIGTVRAFFEANLALTDTVPAYNFFDHVNPIYTHPLFLPASKINGAQVRSAIIADGCIITDANIDRAVIGIRSVIETGSTIHNSVLMGADFYQEEDPHPRQTIHHSA
jgi:glucose-1-phosphate adenylyltransferase